MYSWTIIPIVVAIVSILIMGVVAVDKAERKIPVQYAKKVVGNKMYGGQSTYLPIKANANGVMPLIFAMTIIQFPGMIAQIFPGKFQTFWKTWFGQGEILYYVVYALLILGFAYFYTTISFNTVEISRNLQKNGGFIPGIRAGKPTSDYLNRISKRLTLFGALFLMLVATVPSILLALFDIDVLSAFGPTAC